MAGASEQATAGAHEAIVLTVSVGICVHNEERNVAQIVSAVLREPIVDRVVVVASGCTDSTMQRLATFQEEKRLLVLVEPTRTGKTSAFNLVLDACRDEFLISLPGDVIPEVGSIERLVRSFGERTGMVGGLPIPANRAGTIMDRVAQLVWTYHNEALLRLHACGKLGHVSGEIFAVRRSLVDRLPPDTVNEDASLALSVVHAGYRIAIEPTAKVQMIGARTARDFIIQRRRILVGHRQLANQRRGYGGPPSLGFSNGLGESMAAMFSVLRSNPRLFVALPVAVFLEALSRALAWIDWHRGRSHVVWEIAHSTKDSR